MNCKFVPSVVSLFVTEFFFELGFLLLLVVNKMQSTAWEMKCQHLATCTVTEFSY